tara:strand:+ start:105 stop:326 length:222 start_codon:yes stop_codon:yes gene_type:complete
MFYTIVHYIFGLFQQDPPNKVVVSSSASSLQLIEDMSKVELDKLGKAHGVKLDRRRRKQCLVAKLKEAGIHRG